MAGGKVKEEALPEINGLIALREHYRRFHDGVKPCPYCKEVIRPGRDAGMLYWINQRLEELGVETTWHKSSPTKTS